MSSPPGMAMASSRRMGVHPWLFFFLLLLARACDPGDQESLQGFLDGLDAGIDGWSAASGSCCRWPGVSCSGERVVGVDLFNRSLNGHIAGSLAGLDQLQHLNLSSNFLKGTVPPAMFRLQKLQLLDLSDNSLSGSFPTGGLDLPSLQVFSISYNLFNGSLPILPGSRNLTYLDIAFNMFAGTLDTAAICAASPEVRVLLLSLNQFSGGFQPGFGNCSSLSELALEGNSIAGNLPGDLFNARSLKHLSLQDNLLDGNIDPRICNLSLIEQIDISFNGFSGDIPDIFGCFRALDSFSAQANRFSGTLPPSLSKLSTIRMLSLRNNSLSGDIGLDFTAMPRLSMLDLGSNSFTGPIPDRLSECSELKTLNLANNSLSGKIPGSFANLTSLSSLSLSGNQFSDLPTALKILHRCPVLTSLVMTKSFSGEELMPMEATAGFPRLEVLVIANCGLHGTIPRWLANCTSLKVLDLSWNRLSGSIPSFMGSLDSLFYMDLSNNSLTGSIPNSLTQMKSLVSGNALQQETSILQDFPFLIKKKNMSRGKGLQYYQVGNFPPSLILGDNLLSGPIIPAFGRLKKLLVLDLSKNCLSGTIPAELSGMSSLETLDLSQNNISGSIPAALTKLTFLSNFNVAFNNLSGLIPAGGQFNTFSSADFEGNHLLCRNRSTSCMVGPPPQTAAWKRRKSRAVAIAGMAIGIGLGTALLLAAMYFVVSRRRRGHSCGSGKEDAGAASECSETSSVVLLFTPKDVNELCIGDILKSTNNFDQANIIGCGGFGLVYKAVLPDGRKVAIKRLSGDYSQMEREFQAEVEALSRAQHRNLVLLQGYCRIGGGDRLLIYSFMENGSLDYWLHENNTAGGGGGSTLDWCTRLRIAQGVARGLAYLHQSCQPHILHRDIKSSNILLDESFEAHLADFGLARLVLPYDTHVSTDLVGTLGYIPPEYGQAPIATFKGDVYSFGVVLLELITGRRPMDICQPKECRNVISWVLQMKDEGKEMQVFDPLIYREEYDAEIMRVLDIACLCLNESPRLRPSTHHLVSWLDAVGVDRSL